MIGCAACQTGVSRAAQEGTIDALPTSWRKSSARGLQSRERMLDAAVRLLWRDGYNGVSVNDICAAAGAQKGSFYHAFASKEDLLNAAINLVWATDRGEISAIYLGLSPMESRFRGHLEWFGLSQRRLYVKYGFVPGVFDMALGVNVPASSLDIIKKYRSEHFEMLRNVVRKLVESRGEGLGIADWLATIIGHLISGVLIHARLSNSLAAFDEFPESVLALMSLAPVPLSAPQRGGSPRRWFGPAPSARPVEA